MNNELLQQFLQEDYREFLNIPYNVLAKVSIKQILKVDDKGNHVFLFEYNGQEYIFKVGKTQTTIARTVQQALKAGLSDIYMWVTPNGTSRKWNASVKQPIDTFNQSHTLKEQEHVNAEIYNQKVESNSVTREGSSTASDGGHDLKKIVQGESAKTSPATPTIVNITDSSEAEVTHEVTEVVQPYVQKPVAVKQIIPEVDMADAQQAKFIFQKRFGSYVDRNINAAGVSLGQYLSDIGLSSSSSNYVVAIKLLKAAGISKEAISWFTQQVKKMVAEQAAQVNI